MPNIKSADKRMRLSRVQNVRNRAKRARIRTAMKKVRNAETAEAAQGALREATVLLDRAATKRLLHPNAVARLKGQLARKATELAAS